jgi:hypothetical protein
MEFMLMFYETPEDFAPRDTAAAPVHMAAWTAYIGAMKGSGAMTSGNGLQPPHLSTTVRLRAGKRQVQDGPFAETREQLGGYVILNVDSLDAALEWAARAPCAATGGVEVRPVLQVTP